MKKRKTRRQHMPKKIVMFGGKRVLYIITRTDRRRGRRKRKDIFIEKDKEYGEAVTSGDGFPVTTKRVRLWNKEARKRERRPATFVFSFADCTKVIVRRREM